MYWIVLSKSHTVFRFRPHGMSRAAFPRFDQAGSSGFLRMSDHVFGPIVMPTNQKMRVVRHDGAGVTDVLLRRNLPSDDFANLANRVVIHWQNAMLENGAGLLVEFLDRCGVVAVSCDHSATARAL